MSEHPPLTEAVRLPSAAVAPGAKRIAVLGAGSWGTTFAKVLADGGADVVLWARRREVAHEITETHRNSGYLPGINLPPNLRGHDSLEHVLAGAEQVYLSVPSQSLRSNLASIRDILPADVPVVSLMKGVERGSGLRMSEVIEQELHLDPAASPSSAAPTSRSRSPSASRRPRSSRARAATPPWPWRRSRRTTTSGRS